jgi:predicted RNase H-like HicB family nuclease
VGQVAALSTTIVPDGDAYPDPVASFPVAGSGVAWGVDTLAPVSTQAARAPGRASYTAIVEREGDGYVSLCPELDVASQGSTVEEATANLREAVEAFLECADPSEIEQRLRGEIFVTRLDVGRG